MTFNLQVTAAKHDLQDHLANEVAKYDSVNGYGYMDRIWPAVSGLITDFQDSDTITLSVTGSDQNTTGVRFSFVISLTVQ